MYIIFTRLFIWLKIARILESLDRVSVFPFENFLGKMKKMVRRPQNPISQVVRRLYEKDHANSNEQKTGVMEQNIIQKNILPDQYLGFSLARTSVSTNILRKLMCLFHQQSATIVLK